MTASDSVSEQRHDGPRRPLVVLCAARWAEASRPSITTLQELSARCADSVLTVLCELDEATTVPAAPPAVPGAPRAVVRFAEPDDSGDTSAEQRGGEENHLADAEGDTGPGSDRSGPARDGAIDRDNVVRVGAEIDTDELIDRLGLSSVPTWILLEQVPATGLTSDASDPPSTEEGSPHSAERNLAEFIGRLTTGLSSEPGDAVRWREVTRIVGARPKHEIAERFFTPQ